MQQTAQYKPSYCNIFVHWYHLPKTVSNAWSVAGTDLQRNSLRNKVFRKCTSSASPIEKTAKHQQQQLPLSTTKNQAKFTPTILVLPSPAQRSLDGNRQLAGRLLLGFPAACSAALQAPHQLLQCRPQIKMLLLLLRLQ